MIGILPTIKTILTFIFGFLVGSGVIGVWLNSRFNKKLQRNQHEFEVLKDIKDGFDSDEMRNSMTRLGNFRRSNPSTFIEIFSGMLENENPEGNQLKHDSGNFFHHFHSNVFGRFEKIDDTFIRRAVYISQVQLLLDVVDPIEKTKAKLLKTEYDENIAKECRRIFEDELEK
jgi:hypothetical protein